MISSSFLLFLPSSPDGLSWELVCSYFPLGEDFSSSVFMATYGSLCTESFSWLQCHFTNGSREGWPTVRVQLSASVSAVLTSFGEHVSLNSFWAGFHFEIHSVWNVMASLQPQNCYEMPNTETLLSKYLFLYLDLITVVKWNY